MVRKTKWKPLELPVPTKTASQKPYCISEGIVEVSAIVKDLDMISSTYPSTCLSVLCRKQVVLENGIGLS